jgi:hypothetical protein
LIEWQLIVDVSDSPKLFDDDANHRSFFVASSFDGYGDLIVADRTTKLLFNVNVNKGHGKQIAHDINTWSITVDSTESILIADDILNRIIAQSEAGNGYLMI